ncbi:MAG: hypothetical protein WBB73_05035 [Candidatus Aminicenantaceae bacterium]
MHIQKTVRITWRTLLAMVIVLPIGLLSQSSRQTQADDYTCYELLAPETQSFLITYDVTATTAGAEYFYNAIRVGSEPDVHAVYDLMTGTQLEWKIVDGSAAQKQGLARANPEGQYIRIKLARPVPEGGESRLRIEKTYKDPKSYYLEGDRLIFSRTLGIKRNSIVLPRGYELIECNYPSQIMRTEDERIKMSYMNRGPSGVPFQVEARLLPKKTEQPESSKAPVTQEARRTASTSRPSPAPRPGARVNYRISERAFQDREIVYFLQPPETHSFRLYHDYTESRVGMDRYLNVVRAGSKASDPSAKILDTGVDLKVETLKGEAISQRRIEIGQPITSETEVVVIWFDPVKEGSSVRLRIEETYTDPDRYLLHGGELIWDRSFGRPRNTVILPEGWQVIENSIPAVVSETEDGKIRLSYVNDRQGNIDVFIRARHR